MRRVRVPAQLLAGLAPGTKLRDLAAARAGASGEDLQTECPPELVAWLSAEGLHGRDDVELLPYVVPDPPPEPKAPRPRGAGRAEQIATLSGYATLLLAAITLPLLLNARLWFSGGGSEAGLWTLACMLLPPLAIGPAVFHAAAIRSPEDALSFVMFVPVPLLATFLPLVGYLLIALGNRRSPLIAFLGVFGLLVPACKEAA